MVTYVFFWSRGPGRHLKGNIRKHRTVVREKSEIFDVDSHKTFTFYMRNLASDALVPQRTPALAFLRLNDIKGCKLYGMNLVTSW